ncbi:MAG: metal-sensitive transcriptional regulator [Candidatus Tectomicrobia bacterium]|nr:metal-sensitive transcriptional regulator [Candidatus Tectomicrobia bacterium]
MPHEDAKQRLIARLRRVEGQVRGIQQMVEDDRYCIDILTQLRSAVAAMERIEEIVMRTHLQTCVATAMRSGDSAEQNGKIDEVMMILSRFRR